MKLRASTRKRELAAVLAVSWAMLACGSDSGASNGEGSLVVTVSGEEGAEEGFPFSEDGEQVELADGFQVSFSKFLISIGKIQVKGADGQAAVADSRHFVADLHGGPASLAVFEGLGARRWESFGYEISAPTSGATALGQVDQADVELMRENGFNYWLEGSATRAGSNLTFAWGLANPTSNSDCTNGVDDTQGVVITNNSQTTAEITVHVDHLFWTTLGSEGSELRFEAVAAAGRDDGDISTEDLSKQRLSSLVGMDGEPLKNEAGEAVVYNPESVRLASQDLLSFIQASASSMAHLNGEGLCTVKAAP